MLMITASLVVQVQGIALVNWFIVNIQFFSTIITLCLEAMPSRMDFGRGL